MPTKMYLHLLIICAVWSQGITGTVADEEIRESSNILVRKKRVLNHIPGEDKTVPNSSAPYIVKIKKNLRINCVGTILSHHVVITSTLCVPYEASHFRVVSGSARLDHGTIHIVTDIKRHFGGHPYRDTDGIALLTVDPPFVFGTFTNYIPLHLAPLLEGMVGTISGWGYNARTTDHGTRCERGLRSITVPIMAHRDCVNRYRPRIQISDKDICTYDPQKHCGHNDGGAPLVVDGYLAGVHLWTGLNRNMNDPEYPDVFAVVQDSEYNQWIRSNIENIEAQFQKHHYQ